MAQGDRNKREQVGLSRSLGELLLARGKECSCGKDSPRTRAARTYAKNLAHTGEAYGMGV